MTGSKNVNLFKAFDKCRHNGFPSWFLQSTISVHEQWVSRKKYLHGCLNVYLNFHYLILYNYRRLKPKGLLKTVYYSISVYRQEHREVVVHQSSPWELQGEPGIETGALDLPVSYTCFSTTIPCTPILNPAAPPIYKDPMSIYMFWRIMERGKPKTQTRITDGECLALVREILCARKASWSWLVPPCRPPPALPTHSVVSSLSQPCDHDPHFTGGETDAG